jgi:hypothetical protein
MDPAVEKMEAQLKLWSLKINALAAKTQTAAVPARWDSLMHIDELKALHAIAQSKLIEYKAVRETRPRLKAEMKSAWSELDAALQRPADADDVGGKRMITRRNTDSAGIRIDKSQEP